MRTLFIIFISISFVACEATEQGEISKKEQFNLLLKKYDYTIEDLQFDPDTINLDEFDLDAFAEGIAQAAKIRNSLKPHNEFVEKVVKMDNTLFDYAESGDQEKIEISFNIHTQLSQVSEKYQNVNKGVFEMEPLEYYQNAYKVRSEYPNVYSEEDLKELEQLLRKVEMALGKL